MGSILTLSVASSPLAAMASAVPTVNIRFVPFSAPGNLPSNRLVEDGDSFPRGANLEIRERGAGRREPRWVHLGRCGRKHLDYAAETAAIDPAAEEPGR